MGKAQKGKPAPQDFIIQDGVRTQYAALCFRVRKKKKPQFLMITSRRTKRWIVPKGWPEAGLNGPEAAAQEAWEEAGVKGTISADSIGLYSYTKVGENGAADLPCATLVFPMKVKSMAREFPERRQRRRKWMGRKKAANAVWEPELAELIRSFDPANLRL